MKWLSILSVLLLASVATAQDYAEESGASASQQEIEESDPLALPLIKALIDKVEQGLMPELGGLRIDIQRTAADLANQIRNLPKIPDEIKDILPPQVGVDGSLGFDLRLSATDGERWTTYWHPVSSNNSSDRMVAITSTNTPGYLGAWPTNGVLRTGTNMNYSYGGDYIEIDANASNIWVDIVTNDYYGAELLDVKVAVSTNSTSGGYLGESGTNGVLHVGDNMTYVNWTDFIEINSYDRKVGVTSVSLPGYIGADSGEGVIRIEGPLTKTSGPSDEYVTIGIDIADLIIGITNSGMSNVVSHSELIFGGGTPTDTAGVNTDHDYRYWKHGSAYNTPHGGLWGQSIGYSSETLSTTLPVPVQRIHLGNCQLTRGDPGSDVSIDWDSESLFNRSSRAVLNWSTNLVAHDNTAGVVKSADFTAREAYDSTGTAYLKWGERNINFITGVFTNLAFTELYGPVDNFWDADDFSAWTANSAYLISDGEVWVYSYVDALVHAEGDVTISTGEDPSFTNGTLHLVTGELTINANTASTIADSGTNLFEHGLFVNDGGWVITNITYIAPGGTTNTMTVLAKP